MHFTPTSVWHETGFKMTCDPIDSGVGSHLLTIENLNPQVETRQVMTRWDLLRSALWLIRRAFS